MATSKCQNRFLKSCIAQIDYKHFQTRHGRLQLNDVYICHGFFQKTCKFEEVDSKTFFHKLIKQFINIGFGNPWQLAINIIHETPNDYMRL
jgi:hypothetical protein